MESEDGSAVARYACPFCEAALDANDLHAHVAACADNDAADRAARVEARMQELVAGGRRHRAALASIEQNRVSLFDAAVPEVAAFASLPTDADAPVTLLPSDPLFDDHGECNLWLR